MFTYRINVAFDKQYRCFEVTDIGVMEARKLIIDKLMRESKSNTRPIILSITSLVEENKPRETIIEY